MLKININKQEIIEAIIILLVLITTGCTSSSSSSSNYEEPYEEQDISGVWLGYLGTTFAIGIITPLEDGIFSACLIGQDEEYNFKQFLSPAGSYLTQTPNSAIFTGYLQDCSWNTDGPDYNALDPLSLFITAPAATKRIFGGPPFGAYTYGTKNETGIFTMYYNTTYDVSPNVNNISGRWEMKDIILKDNTVVLEITATQGTSGASLTGYDTRGNTFDGNIVIHYSPIESKPHNVYNVFLKLNDSIDMSGLATYVLESSTLGIAIDKKTLAIGVINSDRSYMLSGFASFIK